MAPIARSAKISMKERARKRANLHSLLIFRKVDEDREAVSAPGDDATRREVISNGPTRPASSADTVASLADTAASLVDQAASSVDAMASTADTAASSVDSLLSSVNTASSEIREILNRISMVPIQLQQPLVLPPMKFHANMARSHQDNPNRSERDRLQRQKNTIATRRSRYKTRLMLALFQKEAEDTKRLNLALKERLAASICYANALRSRLDRPPVDLQAMFQKKPQTTDDDAVAKQLAAWGLTDNPRPDHSGQ